VSDRLILTVRAANGLRNNNIKTIGELVRETEGELLRTPNFGRKSLKELNGALVTVGLHLDMSDAECRAWTPPQELPNPLRHKPLDARTQQIGDAYAAGQTLQEIGEQHSLTRERIRQILLRSGFKKICDEVKREEQERMRAQIRAEHRASLRKAVDLVRGGMSSAAAARETSLGTHIINAACRKAGVRSGKSGGHGRRLHFAARKARVLELRAEGKTNIEIVQVMRSEGDLMHPNWLAMHAPKRGSHAIKHAATEEPSHDQ